MTEQSQWYYATKRLITVLGLPPNCIHCGQDYYLLVNHLGAADLYCPTTKISNQLANVLSLVPRHCKYAQPLTVTEERNRMEVAEYFWGGKT